MKIDKSQYRILVVEDNPGDYLLVEDYLQEHIQKPELTHAKKFSEAKQLLQEEQKTFDIILFDLTLPDVTKNELIDEINLLVKTSPVIILTGYTDLDFASKSLLAGVSDYLLKDILTPFVLYKSILYSLDRYRFIESLKASEKRYMDFFHLSPSPMWVYDLKTLAFLDVNRAAIEHYGYDRKEFATMTLRDIRPPEDIKILEEAIEHTRKKNDIFAKNTFRHKKKNGDIFFVEISSNIITFNNRDAEIVLASDITEKLTQVQAIEAQNKKLKEIAWIQSHVMRAPVARLIGFIDHIKTGDLNPKEKEEMLQHILKATEEIDAVISEIVEKSEDIIKDANKK